MNPTIIIQARTGSTRLPSKMIKHFYEDKSVLDILLDRLNSNKEYLSISDIIVATSEKKEDDKIHEIASRHGVKVYRGSENDVLDRFIAAAEHYGVEKIIRICADNVFLDLESLRFLSIVFSEVVYDYVSFKTSSGKPSILTHYGFWTEGVRLSALKKAYAMTAEKIYHEHVTNYIYNTPDKFRILLFPIDDMVKGIEARTNIRLTLDTKDDFELQQQLFMELQEKGLQNSPKTIIEYIDTCHPEFYIRMQDNINANTK
ncbi:glycosyl transferase family 2 [Muribaculaceae bacterium Isolate-036 (Harlan)]|nr:glycosyl transferase family 2 [Muribaculaceae bacterium Isolate-036 (Harlan)]